MTINFSLQIRQRPDGRLVAFCLQGNQKDVESLPQAHRDAFGDVLKNSVFPSGAVFPAGTGSKIKHGAFHRAAQLFTGHETVQPSTPPQKGVQSGVSEMPEGSRVPAGTLNRTDESGDIYKKAHPGGNQRIYPWSMESGRFMEGELQQLMDEAVQGPPHLIDQSIAHNKASLSETTFMAMNLGRVTIIGVADPISWGKTKDGKDNPLGRECVESAVDREAAGDNVVTPAIDMGEKLEKIATDSKHLLPNHLPKSWSIDQYDHKDPYVELGHDSRNVFAEQAAIRTFIAATILNPELRPEPFASAQT